MTQRDNRKLGSTIQELDPMRKDPLAVEQTLRDALGRSAYAGIPEERIAELETSLAVVLINQRRMQEARDLIHSVLMRVPTYYVALCYELQLSFYLKDPWPEPWRKLEARWMLGMFGDKPILTDQVWDGSPLNGRSILLAGEGGLGDHLQFIRFAKCLKDCGASRVIVSAEPSAIPLLITAPGVDKIVGSNNRTEALACDVGIAMASAPIPLRTTLTNLLNDVPYLEVPECYVAAGKKKIDKTAGLSNVGLCWQSNRKARYVPLRMFLPLTEIPGVQLFGLGETSVIEPEMTGFPIIGLGAPDILSTAGGIVSLDVIISVDAMIAHLGGSLARPV